MSGIFIDPEETVSFNIFVGVDENEKIYVNDDNKKLIAENKEVIKDQVVSFGFVFRKPSYKDNIDMMKKSGAVTTNGETVEFDASALRYERLVTLIKSWTLTDREDKELPPTRENIDRLHPTFAAAILDKLEEDIVF